MSGKYYAARIYQFKNMDAKKKFLDETDAVHIPVKIVEALMKQYQPGQDRRVQFLNEVSK